jgi:hypothetical protein
MSKSPLFKRFIHLAPRPKVERRFLLIFALAKSRCPDGAAARSTLFAKDFILKLNQTVCFQ